LVTVPARILLVRLSHLGDVVLALPVLHALRSAYPRAEIGWAVQPEFASLLEAMPAVQRLFLFERRGGLRAWSRLRSELLDWAPELAVDVQGNTKSAMVALSSAAPRRLGLAPGDWTEKVAAGSVTENAAVAAGPHGMQRARALAAHLAPNGELRRDPDLSREELAQGRACLEQRFESEIPGWILALGDDSDVRSWPSESFGELARTLVRGGESVLLLSGPKERAAGLRLEGRLGSVAREAGGGSLRHWVGQSGLRELAAFFAAAARRGHRLVACDSGPSHLAAAVGLPVDLLAGPQDPRRTGPWPFAPGASSPAPATRLDQGRPDHSRPDHRVLAHPDPPECMPCLARRCAHPRGAVCLSELEPADVAERLRGVRPCA
jgi:ADP-heptose:LPS heptosyltransferase